MQTLHVAQPPKNDWTGVWPVLAALGALIAGVLLFIFGTVGSSQNTSLAAALCGVIIAAFGFVSLVTVGIASHRRTVKLQHEAAARLGFTFHRPVKREEGSDFLRGFSGLNGISAKGSVTWYAAGNVRGIGGGAEGRPVAVCKHVTSNGEEGTTVLVAVTPVPRDWPACQVQKGTKGSRAVYSALAKLTGGKLAPPLAGFDPALMVTGKDEEAVRRLLDPVFERSVAESAVVEQWEVNDGRLALVVSAVYSGDHWLEWISQRVATAADTLGRPG